MIKKQFLSILTTMKIIRKMIWIVSLFLLFCFFMAVGYYLNVTKNVVLIPEKLLLSDKSVTLYDTENAAIKNVAAFSPKQTVHLEEIPQHTQAAFLHTEDKRFYQHGGFDYIRIAGATLHNVKAKTLKEGASTISQQLIKNTHLTQEKTFKRKLREFKLTRQLEKRYTKKEILEKYLNTIYFGHSCFGIKAAADFYFGKTPNELTLSESAILAGLVKAPNYYSPFKNPEKCLMRRNCVLALMYKNKCITEKDLKDALNATMPHSFQHFNHNQGYANFVFDELSELAENFHFKVGGNIEIYTYYDKNLQSQLESIATGINECDKSIFVLDNDNLGFKACLSTVGNIQRLPGSIIKPLLVYAPALEEDFISPATPILDEKISYGDYAPENYDKTYHGYVSVRESIEKSLNIPAVKILSSLGVKKAIGYLKNLHLDIEKEDESLALALGGMKKGFLLQDLVSAYSVFSNNGKYSQGKFIEKIKINGSTVYQRNHNKKDVFSEESAYLMTDMLKSTAKQGTAKKLRSLPMEIAAKTGTVGTEKGNTDAYAISFTKNDTVGVWLGNKNNAFILHTGGGLPCNLLFKINEYLYNDYQNRNIQIESFIKPKNITSVSIDKISYYDTHTIMQADPIAPAQHQFTELFKSTSIPLNKSTLFSNPNILAPTIKLENNHVIINFSTTNPCYYQYKIDRYDYVRHNTVYFGDYIKSFTDRDLEKNKSYIYTITPIYQNHAGTPIVLPTITTKNENFNIQDSNITKEDWWKY